MKKTVLVIISYVVFWLLISVAASFIVNRVPVLLKNAETAYIFRRGFLIFFKFFPALVFSSFLIGCSISFGANSEKAQIRFSHVMLDHFKKVILASIFMVFSITVVTEIVAPLLENKQETAKGAPFLISEFVQLGKENYEKGNMEQAFEFAYNALLLDPKNPDAVYLKDHSEAALNSLKEFRESKEEPKYVYSPVQERNGFTVTELINYAKTAYKNESWFEAHYYSQLALECGDQRDINIDEARRIASEAWNHLFETDVFAETDDQILFKRKRNAYLDFIRGDDIESYYAFLEISKSSDKAERDPDVVRFLDYAEKRISEQCFFTEEYENLRRFETARNVYFTIPHDDGTKDVVYIRGITPIQNSGRLIQYLRGFSMFTYTDKGEFVRSIFVSYAKLLAQNVKTFDDDAKIKYGIKDEFKQVPYIMLESLEKNARGKRTTPAYEYDAEYAKKNLVSGESFIVLGMPLNDFNLLSDCSVGPERMNLASLFKIFTKASSYGYSDEVYGSVFISRILYPFTLLVILVFLASIAWNYRLKTMQLFKFKWIFVMPLCTLALYFCFEVLMFMIKLLNFVLVGSFGNAALFVAIFVEVIFIFASAFIFMSRKTD